MFGAHKTPKVPTPAEAIAHRVEINKQWIDELMEERDRLQLEIAITDTTLAHAQAQLARYEREQRELRDASVE